MNCNDCIHYEVCLLGATNALIKAVEKQCGKFADKSQYIRLPCKVGDTVYMLAYDCTKGIQFNPFDSNGSSTCGLCLNCDKYPCDIHKAIREREISKINIFSDGIDFKWGSYGDFSIKDFGDTVFLTLEEAEKALKEKKRMVSKNDKKRSFNLV